MIKRINKHLFFLQGTNGGRVPYANSLLIHDEVTALIDTGADPYDLKEAAAKYPPDLVINTHFHIDHTRGNFLFPEAKMMAHAWDAEVLSSEQRFWEATGLSVLDEDYLRKNFYQEGLPIYQVEGSLMGDEVLDLGATKLRVIHTPGHTPGHLALFQEEEGILFAGDVDLTSFGPWYGNPAADLEDFRESIKKLRELGARLVLTGHLEPLSEGIAERFDQFLEILEERDGLLMELLREPKTMEAIIDAKLIYRKHPEPVKVYRRFEELMVTKHLNGLEEKGFVIREGNSYRLV